MLHPHIKYILDLKATERLGFSPCTSCKDIRNCERNHNFDKCDIKKQYDTAYNKEFEKEYLKLRETLYKD